MTTTEIPTIVLGPATPVADQSWAQQVHRLAQQPRRSSCTPSYYLGHPAEAWIAALTPHHEPAPTVDQQAA